MSDINDRASGPDGDPRVAALEADIEHTREQLAQTVDQLQARLDVKARASASVHETAEKAKEKVLDSRGKPRPEAIGAAVAGVLAVLLVVLWRQRARRRTTGRH